MSLRLRHSLVLATTALVLTQASFQAAETKKFKLIDAFHAIDPKTVELREVSAKPVQTSDPAHKRALEIVADFAKAGTYPAVTKKFPPFFLNRKRFSGVRVWYRSDSETSSTLTLGGNPRKDGRPTRFHFQLEGKTEWQEALIDFSQFKNHEDKVWDKVTNTAKVYPGGESPTEDDFELINRISIGTVVERRGSNVKSHFMISDLSLIEK